MFLVVGFCDGRRGWFGDELDVMVVMMSFLVCIFGGQEISKVSFMADWRTQ